MKDILKSKLVTKKNEMKLLPIGGLDPGVGYLIYFVSSLTPMQYENLKRSKYMHMRVGLIRKHTRKKKRKK